MPIGRLTLRRYSLVNLFCMAASWLQTERRVCQARQVLPGNSFDRHRSICVPISTI